MTADKFLIVTDMVWKPVTVTQWEVLSTGAMQGVRADARHFKQSAELKPFRIRGFYKEASILLT